MKRLSQLRWLVSTLGAADPRRVVSTEVEGDGYPGPRGGAAVPKDFKSHGATKQGLPTWQEATEKVLWTSVPCAVGVGTWCWELGQWPMLA